MPDYYTSFASVREKITHCEAPFEPNMIQDSRPNSLKSAALRFIHQRCTELRFDPKKDSEYTTGKYTGKSLRENQIPFNMERDVDRLCLERALGDFLDSGAREDAYTVYYCFLAMFLGGYAESKRMFESLSEYEQNASSLLKKHRDHYAHSVYVFALGLAIYETNKAYREAFAFMYGQTDADDTERERKTAHFFLEYWGLCALFHDIGYPFELSYELAMVYYDREKKKRGTELYPAYRGAEKLAKLQARERRYISSLYGKSFERLEEVLAADIVAKLNKQRYRLNEKKLAHVIMQRPECPDRCDFYMDHAYFSAVRLYRQLIQCLKLKNLRKAHFDVLSAIVLHNSLFKVNILGIKAPFKPALKMGTHPLAYLLMLCDELQCWDRQAYGRKSRKTQYPTNAEFIFSDNGIWIRYLFVPEVKDIIKRQRSVFLQTGTTLNSFGLDLYRKMQQPNNQFLSEIASIVDISSMELSIRTGYLKPEEERQRPYMSRKSFLNLYDLAVTLHTLNHADWLPEDRERHYLSQSLEYQLSGINRAKAFAGFLDKVNCFYSERLLAHEEVRRFTPDDKNTIAPLEHGRWMREHIKMGWHTAEKPFADKSARELRRLHHLLLPDTPSDEEIFKHFSDELSKKEQKKDILPFSRLMQLLRSEGVRIYRKIGKYASAW